MFQDGVNAIMCTYLSRHSIVCTIPADLFLTFTSASCAHATKNNAQKILHFRSHLDSKGA